MINTFATPSGAEELMLDRVLPRPAVAELIRAPGAAGEDLRDVGALRCQRLTPELRVGERNTNSLGLKDFF